MSTIDLAANYPKWVNLTIFADPPSALEELTQALDGQGMTGIVAPEQAPGTPADGAPATTASALIASERLLVEHRPAAVLLAGSSDRVLAAGLTASKLEIPVILVQAEGTTGDRDGDRNARLLALLADLTVDPGPAVAARAIGTWLPEQASARSAPGRAGS